MRDLEKYADDYLNDPGFETWQVKYRRKKVLEQIAKYPVKNLLEVGCGVDSLGTEVKNVSDIFVVEPITKFVVEAQKSCPANVRFINTTLEDSAGLLKTQNFDMIVVSSLIHELEDPTHFLSKIIEICGDHTIVHINTPNSQSIHKLVGAKLFKDKASDLAKKFQRHHEYNLQQLIDICEKSGFQSIEKGSYFVKPLPHNEMQKLINQEKITEKTLEGFYKLTADLPDNGSEIFVDVKRK